MGKNKEPFSYLFKRTWRFSEGNRIALIGMIVLIAIANILLLLNPLIFAGLLNEVQANGVTYDNLPSLYGFLSLFVLLHLGFWLFHGPARILEMKNAFFVRKNYKEYLLRNVFALDMSWHGDRDSGDTIDKIEKGTSSLFEFSEGIFIFVQLFVRAVGTTIILFYFNVYAGFALLVLLVAVFFMLTRFDKVLVSQYRDLNAFENAIAAKVFDGLSNITSVLILRIQELVFRDVSKSIIAPWNTYRKNSIINELKWFSGGTVVEIATMLPIALFLYFSLLNGEVVAVGTLTALYLYVRGTSEVFFGFAYDYEQILRKRTAVQNAESLEMFFTDHQEERKRMCTVSKELAIHGLTFSYEATSSDEARHLDSVSLSIKKGERVAMVGASGSGKTTFLKVLHGLYPVTGGSVVIDGKNLDKALYQVDLGTMLVPQEPELFSASIRENITLGVDSTDEEVAEVLSLSRFADVVAGLPSGLESKINEKGVNLSGGQKQRLALARALLFAKGKEILLLDESTSSVDPQNERIIYQNVFSHFSGMTILASIHKFNLLDLFDRVVLFESGKIVGDGTLELLRKHNPAFQSVWDEYTESLQQTKL